MGNGCRDLENLLTETRNRYEAVNKQIAQCPEGQLMQTFRDRKEVFFQVIGHGAARKRISINRRREIINGLARKKYLETERELLQDNINTLQETVNHYADVTADCVLQKLPQRYKLLPEPRYFEAVRDLVHPQEKYRRWMEQPYEQSTYRPSEKTHTTSSSMHSALISRFLQGRA